MSTPNVKLSSGYDMPIVGFGLWKVNNDTCADTVYNAIKVGYRLFDGACGTQHVPISSSPAFFFWHSFLSVCPSTCPRVPAKSVETRDASSL